MFHTTFILFSHCFWAVIDILSVVYLWRITVVLRRSADAKWRKHLHWATPMLIGALLQIPYRLVENTRYFMNLRRNDNLFDSLDLGLMAGAVLGLIGTYRLLRLLHAEAFPVSLVTQTVETWPQAPGPATTTDSKNPW